MRYETKTLAPYKNDRKKMKADIFNPIKTKEQTSKLPIPPYSRIPKYRTCSFLFVF